MSVAWILALAACSASPRDDTPRIKFRVLREGNAPSDPVMTLPVLMAMPDPLHRYAVLRSHLSVVSTLAEVPVAGVAYTAMSGGVAVGRVHVCAGRKPDELGVFIEFADAVGRFGRSGLVTGWAPSWRARQWAASALLAPPGVATVHANRLLRFDPACRGL